MAKTPKNSDKVFGGNSLQAGSYSVKQAIIFDEKATINGDVVTYDCLAIEVLDEAGAGIREEEREIMYRNLFRISNNLQKRCSQYDK